MITPDAQNYEWRQLTGFDAQVEAELNVIEVTVVCRGRSGHDVLLVATCRSHNLSSPQSLHSGTADEH
jgi:hypothetical protein